jgi:hypothetical protein
MPTATTVVPFHGRRRIAFINSLSSLAKLARYCDACEAVALCWRKLTRRTTACAARVSLMIFSAITCLGWPARAASFTLSAATRSRSRKLRCSLSVNVLYSSLYTSCH